MLGRSSIQPLSMLSSVDRGNGEVHRNHQTGIRIRSGDGTVVQLERAGGYGKPETNAARPAVPRVIHAKKRIEDFLERVVGYPGAIIANRDAGITSRSKNRDINVRAVGRVPHSITHYIHKFARRTSSGSPII